MDGQSNSGGDGDNIDAPARLTSPFTRVKVLYNSTFQNLELGVNQNGDYIGGSLSKHGAEMEFAYQYEQFFNDQNHELYIVKVGRNGKELYENTSDWDLNVNSVNEGHQLLIDQYNTAVVLKPEINWVGYIWHQGESDSVLESHAIAYQQNLIDKLTAVRGLISNINIIINRVYDHRVPPGSDYMQNIRDAQDNMPGFFNKCSVVNTDDLSFQENEVHLDVNGYISVAQRDFNTLKTLMK